MIEHCATTEQVEGPIRIGSHGLDNEIDSKLRIIKGTDGDEVCILAHVRIELRFKEHRMHRIVDNRNLLPVERQTRVCAGATLEPIAHEDETDPIPSLYALEVPWESHKLDSVVAAPHQSGSGSSASPVVRSRIVSLHVKDLMPVMDEDNRRTLQSPKEPNVAPEVQGVQTTASTCSATSCHSRDGLGQAR